MGQISHNIKKILIKIFAIFGAILASILFINILANARNMAIILLEESDPIQKQVCQTEKCVQLSSALNSTIDWSVEPCDDFYQFACGKWEKMNPDHVSFFERETFRIDEILHKILTSPATGCETRADKNVKKYYESCYNIELRGKIESGLFQKFLKTTIGWKFWPNVEKVYPEMNLKFGEYFGFVQKKIFASDIVSIELVPDLNNSTMSTFKLIPNFVLYPNIVKDLNGVNEDIIKISKFFGAPDNLQTQLEIQKVFVFELEIFNLFPNYDPNCVDCTIAVGLEKLQDTVPYLNWTELFSHEFSKVNRTIPQGFTVNLMNLEYFTKLTNLIQAKEKSVEGRKVLHNYLVFRIIHKLKSECLLSKYSYMLDTLLRQHGPSDLHKDINFDELSEEIEKKLTQISKRNDEESICKAECLSQTQLLFEKPLGALFIKTMFKDPERSQIQGKVRELFENVRTSFIDPIDQRLFNNQLGSFNWLNPFNWRDSFNWLDTVTKRAIKSKISKTTAIFGYPYDLTEDHTMDTFAGFFEMNTMDYFGNNLKLLDLHDKTKIGNYFNYNIKGRVGDSTKFGAFNYINYNQIFIPVALLKSQNFDVEYPSSFLYGYLGTIIGHEIVHTFGRTGLKFDKNGNFHQTWSDSSIAKYYGKIDCFKKQFGEMLETTADEIISDHGGLNLAFKAYQKLKNSQKFQVFLPDLNLTPDQLFFIGQAQFFCGVKSYNSIEDSYKKTHPPAEFRVKFPLSNSKDFAKAFECKPGARYNLKTEDKCIIW